MLVKNGEFETDDMYISCRCGSHDHMVIVSFDDHIDSFIVFQQLNHYMNIWKRLYHGVRYILGKRSKHVHFTETCIEGEKFEKLMRRMFEHRQQVLKDGKQRPHIEEASE